MLCAKYMQLSQHYEAARALLTRVGASIDKTDLSDATKRLGLEVEKKAVQERNAAYVRMLHHRKTCSVCNQKEA
jgi:ribosomal protein L12E/L44/L45/RPP1/RPP2